MKYLLPNEDILPMLCCCATTPTLLVVAPEYWHIYLQLKSINFLRLRFIYFDELQLTRPFNNSPPTLWSPFLL